MLARAGKYVAAFALTLAGACDRARDTSEAAAAASEVDAAPAPAPAPEVDARAIAYLEDAALEARCDTTTLAHLARSLPRPSPTDSPLVDVFGGIVDAFLGDPEDRLAALGLRPGAPIHLSIRVLDGRAAAVRKLIGELARDAKPEPTLLVDLGAQARALGVHLRASLPTSDRDRLLRALKLVTVTDEDVGVPAKACASLEGVALCAGRSRVILWARPLDEGHVRVDAVYLFHDGAGAEELGRALARADRFAASASAPAFAPGSSAPMQVLIHSGPTRELLRTEALADAAVAFAAVGGEGASGERASFGAYLDRERALRELVPADRIFDGLGLDLDFDAAEDRMRVQLRWLESGSAGAPVHELFAPVVERGTLPVVHGDCGTVEACVRVGGLSALTRFTPLATGPFADTTGLFRVLRQSGDRGLILLGLGAWPHVLGTAGSLTTRASRGVTGKAVSELLGDSYGFGAFVIELGPDSGGGGGGEGELPERWVGYLRVGAEALAAVRPAAALAGFGAEPVDVEGLAGEGASVERGDYEDTTVYLVDEAPERGGFGGWILAADSDARVGWLLETPREVGEQVELDPLWYLRVASLGPLAAREQIGYADDPPVRRWLDGRSLELRGSFRADGPHVEVVLGPPAPR